MKTLLIALLLLTTASVSAQITTKTDEFTGVTSMVGLPHLVIHDGEHSASMMAMHIEGKTYIILSASSSSWTHLNDETGYLIHGSAKTRLNLPALKVSTDTEVVGSSLILTENLAFRLSTHSLNNPVRIRLGGIIYDVPEQVVADVRSIGSRLR